jgi:predicted nucleic acid-binding protein
MGFIVVDNSALLPLFLADEADECARMIFAQEEAGELLIAPSLCLLEFGYAIVNAVRRRRLSEAEAALAHQRFALLPIDFRPFGSPVTLPSVHALAQRQDLTFYDASYLALSIYEGARLATLDAALRAAQAEGVIVL